MDENHHLNENINTILLGRTAGGAADEKNDQQQEGEHQQHQQQQETAATPSSFSNDHTTTTITQEQISAYHAQSLSQFKIENTVGNITDIGYQEERQELKNKNPSYHLPPSATKQEFSFLSFPKRGEQPQGSVLPSNPCPDYNMKEDSYSTVFVRNNSNKEAKDYVDENESKRVAEASCEKKSDRSSHHDDRKKSSNKPHKMFDTDFIAQTDTQSFPPVAPSNNLNINILMMTESRFTAPADDEEERRKLHESMIPSSSSTTENLLAVGAENSKTNTYSILPSHRKEGRDEKVKLPFLGGDDDALSANNLLHSCSTSLVQRNANSIEKQLSPIDKINTQNHLHSSQVFNAQHEGENTFSLSTGDNSAQESSPCKPKITNHHEEMKKLINDWSSDNMIKSTFNVSGGKLEAKKDIVTYKFPMKLYFIVASGHFENIIKWTLKGRAFQIMNKDKFVTEVLPLVFSKNSKFSSFHRKLNRWNFEKVQKETNTWMHPLFQKDRPELCHKISATNSTNLEQNISLVQDLMMRNQGNAFQQERNQQQVLAAPVAVTRNDVSALPYHYPLTLFQNNLGSVQNFNIQSMQSSPVLYHLDQQCMLFLQNHQQGQQQEPAAGGGILLPQQTPFVPVAISSMQQQQYVLSKLPTSDQHSQMTKLGIMTAFGNQSESSMLQNQMPSSSSTGAAGNELAATSGSDMASDIMTRNASISANPNLEYMNNFDVKLSNLNEKNHHTGQVSTSSCHDAMRVQNFLPLPTNSQNRPNLPATTNELIANTSNLMQQTPNESSVGLFGTNLISSNSSSLLGGSSSSVLGLESLYDTNTELGPESSQGVLTSAGVWRAATTEHKTKTTHGDFLKISGNSIERSRLSGGAPDDKTD